ncbi:Hypothetical Protein FCC1311_088682 [Hondaea fermentalgiana]|uniref:Cilia-and flagella-associated protein 96 n=1 Tax=Hondaea fermentalgiana TaxID=2315210 RepID=A0A2R5GVG6_9STRA|nr:Hypothetical Protein FCC1311_088682 [Hondaea fermentalgiana]|eukprot:GBG32643.1 Hypothetical Protein FCC1311_088682 [Hondaea fermentalgiana]
MKGKNGIFHEITPVCVGDPYRDPVQVSRSFAKNKPNFKAGKAPPPMDNTASAAAATATNAAAKVPGSDAANKNRAKPVSSAPFRTGGGGTIGFGAYVGAFSASDSSMSRDEIRALIRKTREDLLAADRRRIKAIRAKTSETKPNFLTRPMKKGSYGTPGVLLSEIYLTSDPREERSRPASAAPLRTAKRGTMGPDRRPFCSAGPATSGIFGRDEDTFIHAPIDDGRRRERPERSRPASAQPFRPSGNVHAPGAPFPYMPESNPSDPKRRRDNNEASGKRESWRPSSASQTRPVRSVMLNPTALKHSLSSKPR